MEFRVLGPLEVRDGGRSLALGGHRQRALLGCLLLHANEVVSTARLLQAVWGTASPASGSAGVQVRISQLRKVLGEGHIATRPPGYLLVTSPGEVDLRTFEVLASEGKRALAGSDPERADRTFEEAMGLWHGRPLADVDLDICESGEILRIEELRWDVLESWVSSRLDLGRHGELVSELQRLVGEAPFRERLREQLMLALYRSGRQAEALAAFRAARRTWSDELGIEPSRRLQRMEHSILNRDPALDPPGSSVEASAVPLGEERKLVTVLTADVVANADAEVTYAWLSRLHGVADPLVEAHGGTVGRLTGGGVLAVFGAPTAQEDHVDCALRAARAVTERLAGIVPVRVAIESGEIFLGRAGPTGPPVSEASRLLAKGRSGDVLVGERAASARVRHVGTSRFVGRAEELDSARSVYARVLNDRRARLLTVVGDAGVGKSRLARELMAALAKESPPARGVEGRCPSYGRGVTYQALGDILEELLGLRPGASRENILERLAGREILALTLGLDVVGDLHPLAALERLRCAWLELVAELVVERPLVLLVEDLHWAQPDLLDLLEHLLEGVAGPLLVVGTGRPELFDSRPSWGRRHGATTIWLEPLVPVEAAKMVADAPAAVRELVLTRAEGNPFFVEELLARVGSGLEIEPSVVPDSVQAVLAARIDHLPAREKESLQGAAVIGRTFWWEPVRELLGGATADFGLLEERDFVRPDAVSQPGSGMFMFKHALTRDVAYASIPRARRAQLHARFAGWLEEHGRGRDEDAASLAYHYARSVGNGDCDLAFTGDSGELGRLRRKAVAWLSRAAELAVGRYEIDEAIALLRRALDLEDSSMLRCALWRRVAHANALKFNGEAFWTAMEIAADLTEDDATRGEIYAELAVEGFVRAGMWVSTPALERLDAWVTAALRLARGGSRARAQALVAKTFRDLEDPDAAGEAAAIAEELDDPQLLVYAWEALAVVAMAHGDYDAGWRWRTRRLDLLERITDPDLRAFIAETIPPACVATCRFDQARAVARLHDELTRSLTPHHRLHGVAFLIEVEELLGDWSAISRLEQRARDAVAANASTPCLRNARSLLVCALAAECLGDVVRARELERQADQIAPAGNPALVAPRLRLALVRRDRNRASALLAQIEADHGWYTRGHTTSFVTRITRLDALAALGLREPVEREAPLMLKPNTFAEPFALRALGIVRGDQDLIDRAIARLTALRLDWHATHTPSTVPA